MLSKKSLQIAAKLGDPEERLYRKKQKKRNIEDMVKAKLSNACTFTPKINRKSRYLDEKNALLKENITHSKVSRHEKLYNLMMKSKQTEMLKRKEKEALEEVIETQECTFQPAKLNNYKGYTMK